MGSAFPRIMLSTREFSVPKAEKYVPRHRSEPTGSAVASPQTSRPSFGLPGVALTGVRRTALLGGVAAAATGLSVTLGVLVTSPHVGTAVASEVAGAKPRVTAAILAQRTQALSRSSDDRRAQADKLKALSLAGAVGHATTQTTNDKPTDPKQLAIMLMPQYGLSASEFSCLDSLWTRESGWNYRAQNPGSGAYGIPQSLPGSKMGTIAADWATNPETQIRWGLTYITNSYGSACNAWGHSQAYGWY